MRRPNFTTESFIKEAIITHNNKYIYSLVNFISIKKEIEISCSIHGIFKQTPEVHLRGHGCPKCGMLKTISHTKSTTQLFIEKSILVHNNLYSYDKVIYINNRELVIIYCKTHGDFTQAPASHLNGRGCPTCAKERINSDKRLTLDEFILRSNIIHNNIYNYDKVIYINEDTQIIINCKIHDDFKQTPRIHLRGAGCRRCVGVVSKLETAWLDILGINKNHRQKTIKIGTKRFLVDAYDPITNTVYEFYGDYWHGNPKVYSSEKFNVISKKTFGDLYDKTIEKENILKSANYKIISIWESDFNE